MSKRFALLLTTSCALSISGCDRSEGDSASDSVALPTRELPAEITVRARPSEAEGRPTEAQLEAPAALAAKQAREAAAAAPIRRAEANLDAVGKADLDALATFEETSDGVEVRVRVAGAKPGTRSVRIYDRADCDDLEDEPLGNPLASSNKQGDLGSVTIGAAGKGTLETKAFNTSLKPDDRGSLLGKTIVVQERDAQTAKLSGEPIACGVIRVDEQLADKAGRMMEPGAR